MRVWLSVRACVSSEVERVRVYVCEQVALREGMCAAALPLQRASSSTPTVP